VKQDYHFNGKFVNSITRGKKMKKATLVVVLALVLIFVMAASAFATTGKFYAHSTSYYQWTKPALPVGAPGDAVGTPNGVSGIGDNPTNPGAHANYLATTAKCGMCHSVHRATAGGSKLLPTADATCSGCHTGNTAITAKIITVAAVNQSWVPSGANGPAGGGGGPHNDSAADLVADGYWDGTGATPQPSYAHGRRYGCWTRRCHATNPHGANASQYKLFAAKLLFNDTPAQDAAAFSADPGWDPLLNTYGGDDAIYDAIGATDASVQRFIAANAAIVRSSATTAGIEINKNGAGWRDPDAAETHALVAGLTCGRPSNPGGYDECHAEASYAIVDKGIVESRNHATGITSPSQYRTDNTGEEDPLFGGNDNRDLKTGHVAGSFDATATHASYAPIAGCTSCHDQTDAANTVAGNFTFPHGQTPTGATNLFQADGVTSATGLRARLWSGYAGSTVDALVYTAGTNQKAYDGQCLKCHRDGAGAGIGLTH
jgi:hypothetical protein